MSVRKSLSSPCACRSARPYTAGDRHLHGDLWVLERGSLESGTSLAIFHVLFIPEDGGAMSLRNVVQNWTVLWHGVPEACLLLTKAKCRVKGGEMVDANSEELVCASLNKADVWRVGWFACSVLRPRCGNIAPYWAEYCIPVLRKLLLSVRTWRVSLSWGTRCLK
jgi:hypothetical protein